MMLQVEAKIDVPFNPASHGGCTVLRERLNGKARKPVIRLRTWTGKRDPRLYEGHVPMAYLLRYIDLSP